MLLVEEVKLLRLNLSRIKELTFATPLMGGGVDLSYELVMYMALARNIYDKIKRFGDRYPVLRRNFDNNIEGINDRVSVSDIFDKIIHGAYIRKSERDLHVESDRGDQYIIDSEEFKSILDALCLSDNESVFIMCQILRDKVQKFQTACEEDIMSDKSRKLSGQIHKSYLMWLISTYCSSEDLSQEVASRLFPEHTDKQFVPPYWYSSSSYGSGQSYFDVEIGSRWDKDGVEVVDSKKISLYDLLLLIENYTGQN